MIPICSGGSEVTSTGIIILVDFSSPGRRKRTRRGMEKGKETS